MWLCPGDSASSLQPGVPGAAIRTRPCRAQVPSFLLCLLLPTHGARASLPHSLSQPLWGTSVPAAVTLGGIWSPPHSSLGAGQMLLLDSWTLLQGWGVPRDLAWQEMELGLWQGPNPRPRGLFCLHGSPSPALPGDLPLLTITHTQPRLAGSAWHGDTSGPSPCLWTSHLGCPHPLSDPVWGQTSLLLRGGHCGPPVPSFHCKGLPQLCGHCPHYAGTHGGNFS